MSYLFVGKSATIREGYCKCVMLSTNRGHKAFASVCPTVHPSVCRLPDVPYIRLQTVGIHCLMLDAGNIQIRYSFEFWRILVNIHILYSSWLPIISWCMRFLPLQQKHLNGVQDEVLGSKLLIERPQHFTVTRMPETI